MADFSNGPLDGIRILDLTSVIMGPVATHVLADLGADVIKIESPQGDTTRSHTPFRNPGMPGGQLNLHRNKRSLVLDLKTEAGRNALARLVGKADAFIHNLRPKAIERLGFGYAAVRAINPEIVYCGAYGFRATGPYGDKPAYDDLIQAGSGIAAQQIGLDGEPKYVRAILCDKVSGLSIAYAVLAALVQRLRGGGGQAIEVPMLETLIEFNMIEVMNAAAFDPPLGPFGYPRTTTTRRKPFRTKDGYVCLMPYTDKNWSDFFDSTGRQDLKQDNRFKKHADRLLNSDFLYGAIEEEAPKRSNAEWVAFCDAANIACMPVLDFDTVAEDPHVKAVGLLSRAEHPTEGPYRLVKMGVSFSGFDFQVRHHAPRLGENSVEILAEAGFSRAEISTLIEGGVTLTPASAASAGPQPGTLQRGNVQGASD